MENNSVYVKKNGTLNKAKIKDEKNIVDYNQQHLRDFLLSRSAISIAQIEVDSKVPNGTLRHFLKNRRDIPVKYFGRVENELMNYGYRSLQSE